MQDDFLPLTSDERAILERLMEVRFEGRDEAREQLRYLTVRRALGCEEHCGSLDLAVGGAAPLIRYEGDLESKIDAEGWAIDDDGIPVEILLFQKQGRLSYLEFVVFSDRLKRRPKASEIEVGSADEILSKHNGERAKGRLGRLRMRMGRAVKSALHRRRRK